MGVMQSLSHCIANLFPLGRQLKIAVGQDMLSMHCRLRGVVKLDSLDNRAITRSKNASFVGVLTV